MSRNQFIAAVLGFVLTCGTVWTLPAAGGPLTPDPDSPSDRVLFDFMEELGTELSRSDRPRDWMLAAHALQGTNGEDVDGNRYAVERADLVRRSLDAAPDDSLLWWQVALACPAMPQDCPEMRALERLKELEPDNAAVWSLVATRQQELAGAAVTDALSDGAREALARAAASTRYEVPIATMFDVATSAMGSIAIRPAVMTALGEMGDFPATELGARSAMALAYTLMLSPHVSQALHHACKPDSLPLADATMRADCLAYSALMVREGKYLLTRTFGLTMQYGLLDGPDALPVRAALRENDWLTFESRKDGVSRFETDEDLRAYLEDWRAGGEIHAMRQRMLQAGVPLVPPADFRSPSVALGDRTRGTKVN